MIQRQIGMWWLSTVRSCNHCENFKNESDDNMVEGIMSWSKEAALEKREMWQIEKNITIDMNVWMYWVVHQMDGDV